MKISRSFGVLATLLLLATTACDEGSSSEGSGSACEGAKCDDNGDDGSQACASPQEMIETARRQLEADEPDFYAPEDFQDGASLVDAIGDLNGDGVEDAMVFPGLTYGGANVEQAIYLSDESGCPASYAGHFGASDVSAAEGESNGVRNVEAVNVSACSAEITTYAYDGERYVELDTRSENLCEAECPTDAEIIETARQQLVRDEPDFYSLDGFREESASVESMDDLNGDGTADFLVAPGLSYSGPNVELAIYLSDADGCAGSYAGHFGASDVSASDGTTNGVRDVKATNVSACSAETTTYAYDGELYQPGSTQSEPLCDN